MPIKVIHPPYNNYKQTKVVLLIIMALNNQPFDFTHIIIEIKHCLYNVRTSLYMLIMEYIIISIDRSQILLCRKIKFVTSISTM